MFFSSWRSLADTSAAGDAVVRPTRVRPKLVRNTNMNAIGLMVMLVGLSPQFRRYIRMVKDADPGL